MKTNHKIHEGHEHQHGPGCGHKTMEHEGHSDYLHDGHLHHTHEGHIDEHVLGAGKANPAGCTPAHACAGHDASHAHGPACGHDAVPHGNHVDYVVDGHLHHQHAKHCDDHGAVQLARS
jgi:hypothetical protein